MRSISRGDWHDIVRADEHEELYDTGRDRVGRRNIAGASPELVRQLRGDVAAAHRTRVSVRGGQ